MSSPDAFESVEYAVDLLNEHPRHAPPQLEKARDVLEHLLEALADLTITDESPEDPE
jgi:hypothetical protein